MNQQQSPERNTKAKIIFDLDMSKKGEWVQASRSQGKGLVNFIIEAVDEKIARETKAKEE